MRIRVAIYSGIIPSTTFIEQLITSLAQHPEVEILLFGERRKKVRYQPANIKVFPLPSSGWKRVVRGFKEYWRLRLTFPNRHKVLKAYLQRQFPGEGVRIYKRWAKYAPVVREFPDIFHVQWAKSLEEWLFLKELFERKLVLSLRGAHINYSPITIPELTASYRRTFPCVDAFHAVSEAIGKEAKKYGASAKRLRVIYSGVDLDRVIPEGKMRKYPSPSRLISILSVGRFHWKKGYTYALDALKLLIERGHNIRYTLIAPGNPEEILYQIHDLGLTEIVTIIPGLPQVEVFKAMRKADFFLLPSVEEGIANAVLEAMALGLPVISSDCGGMREAVIHDRTGWLFPSRDVEAMASTIAVVLRKSNEEIAKVTLQAANLVKMKFSMDRLAYEMLDLYHEITVN